MVDDRRWGDVVPTTTAASADHASDEAALVFTDIVPIILLEVGHP